MIYIVSTLINDIQFNLSECEKLLDSNPDSNPDSKSDSNPALLDKIKDIQTTMDFKLYYQTFDWIICKSYNDSIDYKKIKQILLNPDNIWKDNDRLIDLYFN